ncbi:hypothetical protein CA54_28050 [Symmachiella macrocystis]|uniref:Uncharacterized protein n=1 Tax=Symmachiella macrocystis TaxID=2527985 RepID=A0A5C6BP47_9PLAN|nr:hypothetical protein [Symmachiella macrocystis]TWU13963.1 hypothetical protein CA54_28050 [Symmachiella macrocystis]
MSALAAYPTLPLPAYKSKLQIVEDESGLHVRRRVGSNGIVVFLSLWWLFWTFGCGVLVFLLIDHPSWGTVLFAIPFFALWVGTPFLIRCEMWGMEELVLGEVALSYRKGVRKFARQWTVPRVDIRRVCIVFGDLRNSENELELYGLLIKTHGESFIFADGAQLPECKTILEILAERLEQADRDGDEIVDWDQRHIAPEDVEIVGISDVPRSQPDGSRICCAQADDTSQFTSLPNSRREIVLAVVGVAFLNLFWNGIVGVFIYKLITDFEWLLFFFLIPFEVIGVSLIGYFVWMLLTPWKSVSYAFTSHNIGRRFRLGRFRRDRYYDAGRLNRIELRWTDNPQVLGDRDKHSFHELGDDSPCSLAFVDNDNRDTLEIFSLTEAEARWMADVLLRGYHGDWFEN